MLEGTFGELVQGLVAAWTSQEVTAAFKADAWFGWQLPGQARPRPASAVTLKSLSWVDGWMELEVLALEHLKFLEKIKKKSLGMVWAF